MAMDLFHTACYVLLAHLGYGLVDSLLAGKDGLELQLFGWAVAAVLLFFLTKARYDKESEEAE